MVSHIRTPTRTHTPHTYVHTPSPVPVSVSRSWTYPLWLHPTRLEKKGLESTNKGVEDPCNRRLSRIESRRGPERESDFSLKNGFQYGKRTPVRCGLYWLSEFLCLRERGQPLLRLPVGWRHIIVASEINDNIGSSWRRRFVIRKTRRCSLLRLSLGWGHFKDTRLEVVSQRKTPWVWGKI